MADRGFDVNRYCLYNGSGACNYALAIGVLAFLICIVFILKDVIMVLVDFSGAIIVSDNGHTFFNLFI